jgi:hypothetical protein
MTPLTTRKERLWGQEYDVAPYLLRAIHGDGKQWLHFGYLDDRPWYYVVRVDSSVVANNDNNTWYEEVLEWIYEQLEEEGRELMTDEQDEEWGETGNIENREWPIPPITNNCGCEWGSYTPLPEDLEIAKR